MLAGQQLQVEPPAAGGRARGEPPTPEVPREPGGLGTTKTGSPAASIAYANVSLSPLPRKQVNISYLLVWSSRCRVVAVQAVRQQQQVVRVKTVQVAGSAGVGDVGQAA